ncbi:HNH endonuclease signature motif containing protein [Arthrobacter sp. zg-Y1171]|uniref:HNH endonuclease signature motif containing protein n=1 Tax=Arthrobacter sp. zg-Y1171 TaxID=2964610 RepID=UPI0021084FF4|nr:HNH endonuclease signature motif containing protein [Arthrobacter sp. zg-Y1171]MCQ1996479.1 HNH endonuclease [Arthrobacter sp. zg-Y1171]UWX82081.1 HNH endonuclease [Arthrobacter sp. zg-Y1171]
MDQLGNTERITKEPGRENQQPEGTTGEADAPRAACTLSVYRAGLDAEPTEPADASTSVSDTSPDNDAEAAPTAPAAADGAAQVGSPASAYPDGFTGTLALQNLEAFDDQMVGDALSRMAHLVSWVQAQEARLMIRMMEIFRDSYHAASGRLEPGMALSLAASECAAILNIPQVTAQRMMLEADKLCSTHTATLTGLEEGNLSYQHAQVLLDQCQNVPATALPEFEADLLAAAPGHTRAQFACKARRLREKQYPETVTKRHLTAFEQRKVTLDREEDGMSWLSAHLRAEDAQQIYTTLSTAAQGEQTAGDSRTTDQLRADILAQLLMGGTGSLHVRDTSGGGRPVRSGGAGRTVCDDSEIIPRAEIMVLINAETLFGADDQPAELHGYGPISAEAARRLARNAVGWTGLAQNPHSGEILGVGRRRKVPAGLRRWLRARDGTCRFPGCRVSTANADIDHTIDWARGGPTDHGNLEHLCRRHHRFKTLGFWKARQPTPGVIEWTSPSGRVYRTEPLLKLEPLHPALDPRIEHGQTAPRLEAIPRF